MPRIIPNDTITIEITTREAHILKRILGNVGGFEVEARQFTDTLHKMLPEGPVDFTIITQMRIEADDVQ